MTVRFKVGDHVRLVETEYSIYGNWVGHTGNVTAVSALQYQSHLQLVRVKFDDTDIDEAHWIINLALRFADAQPVEEYVKRAVPDVEQLVGQRVVYEHARVKADPVDPMRALLEHVDHLRSRFRYLESQLSTECLRVARVRLALDELQDGKHATKSKAFGRGVQYAADVVRKALDGSA